MPQAAEDNKTFDKSFLKKKLELGQPVNLTVVSDSMTPLIRIGEQIQVRSVEITDLQPFDLILFDQGNKLNVHFLTELDHQANRYITLSLKNPVQFDYPLKRENILGLVLNKKLTLWHKFVILIKRIRNR